MDVLAGKELMEEERYETTFTPELAALMSLPNLPVRI